LSDDSLTIGTLHPANEGSKCAIRFTRPGEENCRAQRIQILPNIRLRRSYTIDSDRLYRVVQMADGHIANAPRLAGDTGYRGAAGWGYLRGLGGLSLAHDQPLKFRPRARSILPADDGNPHT